MREARLHQRTGGVGDERARAASIRPVFKPGLRAAVNLDQLSQAAAPLYAGEIDLLRALGHHVVVGDAWSEGSPSACSRERDAQGRLLLRAGANQRGLQGYAVGR